MFCSFLHYRFRQRNETGFSLLEVVVVLGMILVVFGTAVFNVVPALNTAKSNTGIELVLGELRRAHERAVDERRIYCVTFVAPQTIQVDVGQVANIAATVSGSTPVFVQAQPPMTLPPGVQFAVVAGIPTTAQQRPMVLAQEITPSIWISPMVAAERKFTFSPTAGLSTARID
jgi:type II secretory pathway pseudopilin PulG